MDRIHKINQILKSDGLKVRGCAEWEKQKKFIHENTRNDPKPDTKLVVFVSCCFV